ncbi:META domain-containing protein [Phaeovulum sp.]|uniref:META domain-containing protein n=1 Tax=Phaeovulum sp. TaxID=2934796 RepID=UPI0039E589E6
MTRLLPFIALLSMAACQDEGAGVDPLAALPTGSQWQVVSVSGQPVPEGIFVTIERPEPAVLAGTSGCNRYSAALAAKDGKVSIGALAGTRMMCPPPAMETETAFHSVIGRVTEMRQTGETLDLLAGDTVVISARK